MNPTSKFIEGVVEECFRQGLTEKQASIVLDYATYRAQEFTKQADGGGRTLFERLADNIQDAFGFHSDPAAAWEAEHPQDSIESHMGRLGKYQRQWKNAYNDAYRRAYYDETGAPRKTPLYNGDVKAIQQAAYRDMLTKMDGGRSLGLIREADRALAKIDEQMEFAKRKGDKGMWRDLNEQRTEWLKRQMAARNKANAINEEALREITGAGELPAEERALRDAISQHYTKLKEDYDDAQNVKWWNPFSWTAAIGAPTKEELDQAKSRAQAVFQADQAREMAKNFAGIDAAKNEAALWRQEHNAVTANPAAVDSDPQRQARMDKSITKLNDQAAERARQQETAQRDTADLEELRRRTRNTNVNGVTPSTSAGGSPTGPGTGQEYDIVRVPAGMTKVPDTWIPHTSGTAYGVERRTYKVPKQPTTPKE